MVNDGKIKTANCCSNPYIDLCSELTVGGKDPEPNDLLDCIPWFHSTASIVTDQNNQQCPAVSCRWCVKAKCFLAVGWLSLCKWSETQQGPKVPKYFQLKQGVLANKKVEGECLK